MLKGTEEALAVAIKGVKAERKSTALGAAIIGALIGFWWGQFSGAVIGAGIGFAWISIRSNPQRPIDPSSPTELEDTAARARASFEFVRWPA